MENKDYNSEKLIKFLVNQGFYVFNHPKLNNCIMMLINAKIWMEIKYWIKNHSDHQSELKISIKSEKFTIVNVNYKKWDKSFRNKYRDTILNTLIPHKMTKNELTNHGLENFNEKSLRIIIHQCTLMKTAGQEIFENNFQNHQRSFENKKIHNIIIKKNFENKNKYAQELEQNLYMYRPLLSLIINFLFLV